MINIIFFALPEAKLLVINQMFSVDVSVKGLISYADILHSETWNLQLNN